MLEMSGNSMLQSAFTLEKTRANGLSVPAPFMFAPIDEDQRLVAFLWKIKLYKIFKIDFSTIG